MYVVQQLPFCSHLNISSPHKVYLEINKGPVGKGSTARTKNQSLSFLTNFEEEENRLEKSFLCPPHVSCGMSVSHIHIHTTKYFCFFEKFYSYCFKCISGFPVLPCPCPSICRGRKWVGSLGNGVIHGSDLPFEYWESTLGPLEEHCS